MRNARCALARLRDRRGIAALEFALVAPLLLLMILTTYDVATAMWRTTRLELAARTGAQYAFAKPQDSAGIRSAAMSQLAGWSDVAVASTTMACRCDDGAAVSCATGTCTSGSIVLPPIGTVSITVTQPFQFSSPITAALFPGFSTLRGNVELRFR